jgi:hypothetical protein
MDWRWFLVLSTLFLLIGLGFLPEKIAGTAAAYAESEKVFSSASWISAKKDPHWSRQKLMEQFCKQYSDQLDHKKMDRTKILALLGNPEMSSDYLDGQNSSSKQIESTITDRYQLTKDKGFFEVAYSTQGMVNRYNQSDQPLIFEGFIGPVRANSLSKATLANIRQASKSQSIDQVIQLLGPPGKSVVDVKAKFATPFRSSSYYWNLSADGRKILWVSTSGMFDQDLNRRSINAYCVITLSLDCPVKP